ncbi:ATP synthase complex subunit H-domain-containing protein [Syncephalis pseudoplumigaleata]|uniref:ATP synthase complex subunit H-domain-containing protein n=1 Tax=Syncephalis pseudoplumigaleata TaxID=1712513 RepID=A0A4P9YR99_9FUNG|nr:ATP synthase complex subunit H-domain-containing protein [Syncephalis pseudoplumigaleata]|eukprot:RKP22393.1 ATP synthase complex subunit H-domain-containing protein [Syncephalis pseudoplumigaleata]
MQFRATSQLVRTLRRPAFQATRTFIAPSAVVSKDMVQDIFIRELRNYKPSAAAKDSEADQVKQFRPPAPPTAPTVEVDMAAAEAEYTRDEVVAAAQSTGADSAIPVEYIFPKESEAVEQAH